MEDASTRPESWNDAISAATRYAEERAEAAEIAASKQKPKSDARRIVAAFVAVAAVAAWNVYVGTRPLPEPPAHLVRWGAAWHMVDEVEAVLDFQDAEGRLPSEEEALAFLGERMLYVVTEEGFTLTLDDPDIDLEYDSAVPLEAWIEAEVSTEEEG